tara:strand:- start:115 stop:249 length:135 start_codon:yes stop_codon:yes gene_type:complete
VIFGCYSHFLSKEIPDSGILPQPGSIVDFALLIFYQEADCNLQA